MTATPRTSYPTIAPNTANPHAFSIVLAGAMQGNLNVGGSVTLNGSTQVLHDSRIGGQSLLLFMATSAAAAAVAPTIWVSNRGKGAATLHFAAASNADVDYVVIG